VVSYPARSQDVADERLRDVLTRVSLPHLRGRLDEEQDWATVLSPGEQQRIAFARVLLSGPAAVFLDEATSALDEGLEFALYDMLRTDLPDTIVVSVGHHGSIERHHDHHLRLLGNGDWRLDHATAARSGVDGAAAVAESNGEDWRLGH
jgi:vitamin B12/bleomycin/antimicrobial peptide transport system ATP-binding/permease protein